MQNHGPQALSNAELLAIILRTGTTRNNVIELAGILLAKFGGLGGLMRADFMELCKEYGPGTAKAAQLKAALEIGRRLGLTQLDEKYQFYFPRPPTAFNVLARLVSWLYCPLIAVTVCCHLWALLSTLLSGNVLEWGMLASFPLAPSAFYLPLHYC
jgi:hypothetical protein